MPQKMRRKILSMYIKELPQWPDWQFDLTRLAVPLAEVRHLQGRLIGRMEALGFPLQDQAELSTLTQDVIPNSGGHHTYLG